MQLLPRAATLFPYTTLFRSDSGGGHRAAATALAEVIRQQSRPWDMRLLSIQDHFGDRKSTRLNSSHVSNSYAVFCLKKIKKDIDAAQLVESRLGETGRLRPP